MQDIQLESSWLKYLINEFSQPYMLQLKSFLLKEITQKHKIYPKPKDIFRAFDLTPFDKVKVVLIGQDPYHGLNQAHGLSFSVDSNTNIPPSLKNIFIEIKNNFPDYSIPQSGDLSLWAKQGVLLLNAILTVRANEPCSHQNRGWEIFTDRVIALMSLKLKNIIFLLWGRYAQAKGRVIDKRKHLVLQTSHPSPFAAHQGFFGCKHFLQVNQQLEKWHKKTIIW